MLRFTSRQVCGLLPILAEKPMLSARLQRVSNPLPAIQTRPFEVPLTHLLQQRPQESGQVLRDEQEQPGLVLHQGNVLRNRVGFYHHQSLGVLQGQVHHQLQEGRTLSLGIFCHQQEGKSFQLDNKRLLNLNPNLLTPEAEQEVIPLIPS